MDKPSERVELRTEILKHMGGGMASPWWTDLSDGQKEAVNAALDVCLTREARLRSALEKAYMTIAQLNSEGDPQLGYRNSKGYLEEYSNGEWGYPTALQGGSDHAGS